MAFNASPAQTASVAKTSEGAVTLGATSATVAAANDSRVAIYMSNTHGSNDVYLSLGGTAQASKGIYLKAGGGSCSIDNYTGLITGIATGAGTIVTFSEI